MNKITFDNIMPQVFQQASDLNSEVWGKHLEFEKGKLYLVEAASGKGKSTFCSYILGYRNDFSGELLFDGESTRNLKVSDWVKIRQQHISHLFQELRLFPELTAMENILIKNKLTSGTLDTPDTPGTSGTPGFISEQQIEKWFNRLGIGDKLDAKIGRMSFGQQQRVAMIRALAQPFDFLLVDEPISHLDDNNSAIMADIMMSEARRQGACVIVTSIGKHMNLNYDVVVRL